MQMRATRCWSVCFPGWRGSPGPTTTSLSTYMASTARPPSRYTELLLEIPNYHCTALQTLTDLARRKLKRDLAPEYELYNFVQARLARQYRDCTQTAS